MGNTSTHSRAHSHGSCELNVGRCFEHWNVMFVLARANCSEKTWENATAISPHEDRGSWFLDPWIYMEKNPAHLRLGMEDSHKMAIMYSF
jgi:hypothetical protein